MASSSSKLTTKDFLSPPPPPPSQRPQLPIPPPPPPLPQPSKTLTKLHKKSKPLTSIDILSPSQLDISLSTSSHLTRQELLNRRLHRLRQLSKVYRDHYWALMEDLRVQYRDYYWKYGVSPHKEEDERESAADREFAPSNVEGCGETTNHNTIINNSNSTSVCVVGGVNGNGGGSAGGKLGLGLGFGENGNNNRCGCAFVGCKLKAMALTSFCHLHILSDPQQKLYKACNFVIKSAQAGPILCGKPILRSTVPSLCNIHFQKAQKHVTRALKKAGLNVSSSTKLAPKFQAVITEYVNQVQSKRRAAQKANSKHIAIKEEPTS